jgi:hypothetical protein
MDKHAITLTERIVFAEDWLDRARRQLQQGEVAGGALAMLLAEAELSRAREAGLPTVRPEARARSWMSWAALAALAFGGLVLALSAVAALRPGPAALARPAIPALTLASGNGELLRLVRAPEPAAERTVVRSRVVRIPVPVPAPARRPAPPAPAAPVAVPERQSPPAVHPSPAPQAASAPLLAPAAQPVPAAAVLSEAEVIDMVLAAERSLRRAGNQ